MSRSYKKTPYAGLKKCKFSKNYSNRKIRKTEEQQKNLGDGGSFKRILNPWDICDYKSIETWQNFKQRLQRYFSNYHNGITKYAWRYYCNRYNINQDSPDCEKLYRIWYKEYKKK